VPQERDHVRGQPAADRPISPSPHHAELAGSRYGLGPSDPAQIDLVRLGLAEDSLV
jgi:hypothetical protein